MNNNYATFKYRHLLNGQICLEWFSRWIQPRKITVFATYACSESAHPGPFSLITVTILIVRLALSATSSPLSIGCLSSAKGERKKVVYFSPHSSYCLGLFESYQKSLCVQYCQVKDRELRGSKLSAAERVNNVMINTNPPPAFTRQVIYSCLCRISPNIQNNPNRYSTQVWRGELSHLWKSSEEWTMNRTEPKSLGCLGLNL